MDNADYIRVKDKNNLLRDSYSQGIVNCDVDSYNAYIENYKRKYKESQRLDKMENDLISLKDDIGEIKNLLRNLAK